MLRRALPGWAAILGCGVAALSVAPLAQAAPGKPELLRVDTRSMRDATGSGVTFGWKETTFDPGTTNRSYSLTATSAAGSATPVSVSATGDTSSDRAATLQLVDGRTYSVAVRALQYRCVPGSGCIVPEFGPFSDARTTTADFTAPARPYAPINHGDQWTNRLTVGIQVVPAFGDSDVNQAQVSLDGSFPCNSGGEDTCPFPASDSLYPTMQRDLPPGDGSKSVFTFVRDSARHPALSRQLLFFSPPQGNVSQVFAASIGVDRTPPVAKLVDAAPGGTAGTPVALDATPSTDALSGVDPNGFVWSFGDGSADVTGAGKLTHVYPGPGSYTGRVIVHDRAGHLGAPKDTNFSSAPFTVTVAPAPVGGGDTGGPAPTGGGGPAPTGGAPAPMVTPGPAAPSDNGPAQAKPDIPLVGTVTSKTGPIASARLVGTAKAGKPISVRLTLRKRVTVKVRLLDGRSRVVSEATSRRGPGAFTARLRGPSKPGSYKLVATAGKAKLTLPVAVKGG